MQVRLMKEGSCFAPYDSESEDYLINKKDGQFFICDIKTPRNYEFHKKLFALLNIAYAHWEPKEFNNKHGKVERNFDQFREDIIIMCGYYEQHFRLDGSFRVKAKSISFAEMDNEEFEKLYNTMITVVIKKILTDWTIEKVHEAIGNFL